MKFLVAFSFEYCDTSARVIVYIIYTRPTVQTSVINRVLNTDKNIEVQLMTKLIY